MSLSSLCKVCFHYNHAEKTCGRSVIAVSRGRIFHDYAKAVRLDKSKCGPEGKWFVEAFGPDGLVRPELTPLEELMESFDI